MSRKNKQSKPSSSLSLSGRSGSSSGGGTKKVVVPTSPSVFSMTGIRHLVTGGFSLLSAPKSLMAVGSSIMESGRLKQYQNTYNAFRQHQHSNPDVSGRKALSPMHKIILNADRMKKNGDGKTALRLAGKGVEHLDIGPTTKGGRTQVTTHTMLMMESPAFAGVNKTVSGLIKHQDMVIKRKVDDWVGMGKNARKVGKPDYRYTVLAGTDEVKHLDKKGWKNYKAQYEKIGRVRITPDQANTMEDVHNERRKAKLETDPNQPKLFGHSIRFLTEYTRLNVCQTHMRDTMDKTLGSATTDRLTKTFGFTTQGRRHLG